MKKYLLVFLALSTLVACNKPTVKEQYEALTNDLMTAYEQQPTQEGKDSVVLAFVPRGYAFLMEHIGEPYSDSVFLDMYGVLDDEQIEAAFAAMPEMMLKNNEQLAQQYSRFSATKNTQIGCRYIDFALAQPDGKLLSLSELVGNTEYVLIDFWASWCRPCRQLLPVLKEIYNAQPAGRLQILGVSVDRDEAAWLRALEQEQLPWRQVRDTVEENAPSDQYGVMYIPTTLLLDREGTIIARNPSETELIEILNNNK
ncbi:MAG: TlpA family protein disulfide reductase [Paludibacteraceae bacterium]